jgi:hypothetical protein
MIMSKREFEKGDVVFHLSYPKQLMVVISVLDTIQCRWITNKFKCKIGEFYDFELVHNEPPTWNL